MLVCLVGLLLGTTMFAQDSIPKVDESKNFLMFYGGGIKYVDGLIRTKSPFFKKSYFEVNDQKYDLASVQFYNNSGSFYGNTYQANGANVFAERILRGKVNYFEAITTGYSAPMMNANGQFSGGGSYSKKSRYYNKGFGPLKKANYANLANDLVDNQESMLLLQRYNKVSNREVIIYVIAGIATVAGILTAGEKTGEQNENFNPSTGRYETQDEYKLKPVNLTIGLIGFTTCIVNYFKSKKKYDYLEDAIYMYNK